MEDLLVGALPWDEAHKFQVPTSNAGCGRECFFPQKPAEHPLMFDRFAQYSKNASRLQNTTTHILRHNDWFWVLTGVHQGGGLDASLVIRKAGTFEVAQPWTWLHLTPFLLILSILNK